MTQQQKYQFLANVCAIYYRYVQQDEIIAKAVLHFNDKANGPTRPKSN